jgi:type IV pilus biogenesis protein CpaD/CtpE
MNKRMTLVAALVFVLVAALTLGLTACGSSDKTTTTAAPATTTTAASVTTTTAAAGTATTAAGGAATTLPAGSFTVPSIEMTADVQAYIAQMQTFATALSAIPDADDPLNITSVSGVTDAQITAAEAISTQAHAALDQLKAITPPASLKQLHDGLTQLIATAVDATDKAISALKSKDQAALDAAIAQAKTMDSQMNSMFESLAPLLMGGTPTS